MSQSNESGLPFKNARQLLTGIALAFIIPVVVIVLLVKYVNDQPRTGAGVDAMSAEAIAERIRPVAQIDYRDPNAAKVLKSGDEVYTAVCAGCHTTGAAGAPKLGDKSGWSARLAQGYDTLVRHAIEGIRGMPAKGGSPDLDDIEVARAVAHLTNSAGANFKAPEPKAASAEGAVAAAAQPASQP
jgi:cytochrome c5